MKTIIMNLAIIALIYCAGFAWLIQLAETVGR